MARGAVQNRPRTRMRAGEGAFAVMSAVDDELGLAGLKLVDVPGASIIIVVALGAGVTALLVLVGRHTWIRYQRGRNGRLPVSAGSASD